MVICICSYQQICCFNILYPLYPLYTVYFLGPDVLTFVDQLFILLPILRHYTLGSKLAFNDRRTCT